ncbi:MAG: UDP-2,3-diacylglucosamine diphosphatase LpxI [Rhodobacterales bacterium]|nr:UDP-2,3-diacylglucosamine diphosphatase LpxI [Rhodobacterales bacterium]MDX5392098.1 UDP-2,3-diacylglucosamine diphosphatase LpxI [Rhodobacterales bacterium]MDX5491789.1 UDP-2,3-diacylglucosamine diphosphatase LpxI [Rhodobacterales bacterium]
MLALIAGRGQLPGHIVAAHGMPILVAALEGFAPDHLTPDIAFRVERLGSFIADLQARGVTEICMAGAIGRPALDPAMIDAATMPLVPRMMQALGQGDDGALRVVIALFEEAGFTIRAAHEICPDLLLSEGVPTKVRPGPLHEGPARLGKATIAEMGRADQGQACVIRRGDVLAREGADGTDAMLARLGSGAAGDSDPDPLTWGFNALTDAATSALDWLGGREAGNHDGAILYKAPKPGQDRRVDLPTIGPGTAMRAADAGLDGIVIEAGGVLVLDLPSVLRILDEKGLFLWVRAA